MANFKTNFSATEVNSKKLEGQKNPLSGKVEEVQAKFDALPLLVKQKLEDLISELNTKLSNVENTADKDKPLSTEGFNKLADLKTEIEGLIESSVAVLEGKHDEDVSGLENSIAQKIAELVGQAPETLDTLQEIAEALADNEDVVTEMIKMIGEKASQTQVETIEAAVRLLNTNKVDKVEGKGLSTNDFTNEEKEKLAELENYNDYDVKRNIEKLKEDTGLNSIIMQTGFNYLEKYGTTDVQVLRVDVDVIVEDNEIIGTVEGRTLDFGDATVAVPDGITAIRGNIETFEAYIKAKKIILPETCIAVDNEAIYINEQIILSDGMKSFRADAIGFTGSLYLPKSLTSLQLEDFKGNIYCSELSTEIDCTVGSSSHCTLHCPTNVSQVYTEGVASIYVYNPSAEIHGIHEILTLYGYAGSTAEAFAKENGYTFVNIGSDYSIPINDSTATEATIKPNEYYTFTGDEEAPLASLTVTLDIASTTKLDEFMFSFETPSDISSFSFGVLTDESVEIKWIKEPNLKPDYIYEVSVANGVGVIAGTAKEVA